ncbi:MAG: caspase family protein, partial [Methyloligellaceae bacterium]
KLGDFVGHTSDVWAVAVSPDGRLLLSGSDDQTLRLWNVATRENIVTLFHSRNGEWVMWTPQGYYAASPKGDKHVGWHINQGAAKAARLVTAAQLKRHFYRPDIVKRAILLRSARAAVKAARGTDFALGDLLRRQPPAVAFVTPENGATTSKSPASVTLRLAANRDPAERIDVTVNGRRVVSRALKRQEAAGDLTLEVPLSAGSNRILVAVHNAVGRTLKELVLEHSGARDLDRRGTLFVLSIGVDAYPNFKGQNLQFAGADARALHAMLIDKAGPLHAKVKSLLLADKGTGAPNAKNIRDALKLLRQAGPRDTIVVFLAGHGVNDGADYLFLPTDARRKGKAWQAQSVVDWRALQDTLQSTRGRRILLVDTCHAGNAFNARLVKDAADASIVVFAATDADTLAQERPALKHGVFTHAILQGLKGAADAVPDRNVRVRELSNFVTETVKSLTKGAQEPTFYVGEDFIVSRH